MNRKERRRQKKKNIILGINANKFSSLDSDTIALNLKQAAMAISMENPKLALHIIDEILQAEHNHPDALNIKADLLLRSGEIQGAIRLFIKIINVVPDFAQAHFNLGTALNSVGKTKRAIKSLQHALKIEPDYIDAHFNLANSWRQCGNTHASVEHYLKALNLDPNHSAAATNLASAQLELGNPEEAYKYSMQAQKIEPGNRDAFAFRAIAATEMGDKHTASHILNPNLFVYLKQFKAPDNYDSLIEFNKALVKHVLAHPTLHKEPLNKATRNGQQTDNLALGGHGPITDLKVMIGEALDEYLEIIKSDEIHPYPALIPDLTKIDIWGTVLGTQGHQTTHMHRAAWVSGVYYAKLPDVMHNAKSGNEGWIEFCRPPDDFFCTQEHDVKIIRPKEGAMILFPSYMYHRTIPFESDEKRISIAFDLLD
jgi:tetratricopeptide (TPR) repeat protein